MDAKAAALETTSNSPSSPGSSSSSSYDDFVDNDRDFKTETKEGGEGGGVKEDVGNSDGRLVSGEEGFSGVGQTVPENSNSPYKSSSESSMPQGVSPAENSPADVDGGGRNEGDEKVRVFNEEESTGEASEVSKATESEDLAGKRENGGGGLGEDKALTEIGSKGPAHSGEIEPGEVGEAFGEVKVVEGDIGLKNEEKKPMPSGGAEDDAESATSGRGGEKSGEDEPVKFTAGGDSIVDSVHVDVSPANPGVAVVGNVGDAERKGAEVLVDESASQSNDFDKAIRDVVEADDLTPAYDGNAELVASNIVGANEVEPHEPKADVLVINGDKVASNALAKPEGGQDTEESRGYVEVKPVEEIQKEPTNEYIEEGQIAYCSEDIVAKEAETLGKKDFQKGEQDAKESEVSERALNVTGQDMDKNKSAEGEIEGSGTDGESDEMIYGSSEAAKQFLEELEKAAGIGTHPGQAVSNDQSERVDGQIVTDSDEEVDTDDEGEGKELFNPEALTALLKATMGSTSDDGATTVTSQDGSRLFTVERPAGLGSSLRSLKPAPRSNRSILFNNVSPSAGGETEASLSEEERRKLERLQQLRVKFLRLAYRLGHSAEDSVVAQVLYRLALLGGRQNNQVFNIESAKTLALQLEEETKKDLDFSLTILVLGKAGVGKSATINSIFGDQRARIDAFEPATTKLREITGVMDGVKVRVIDTPGLKSSALEQCANRKLLSSVKKKIKKTPPDVVIYVDRLDSQSRDLNDLPLLRTVVAVLGSATWRNAIVALTHAASAPPDGPSGSPLSYDVFVAQRSHVVQQSIGQAIGDIRYISASFTNPVALVENHPSCRKNREGHKVLPNGQTWRPQLLLLCYSMKILADANSIAKPYDPFAHPKLFGFRVRSPPLPYLLSWLLQSRAHPKLPADQGGDSVDSDIDLDDISDSDHDDDEDEYDQLPPFKPLRKAQLAKLTREQKRAYFEEYDYRVKLLQKKQWKEELTRMRDTKKKGKSTEEEYRYNGEEDPENGAPAAVPVPLPDMVLPPSFDSDNPAYRYRFLEPTSQLLTRPVLDTHGWDHDCGYDGVNIEHSLALINRFPAAVTVQLTKDKKEFNIHMDSSISTKHGENSSSMAGFDIQNVGRQLAYVVRGETKFKALKKNKAAVGASVTFIGENVATGVKLEDQISLGKRLALVGSTGTVRSQGDSAYGVNLEVRLREADFPIGQDQSSLSLSLVKWRGDLALGANVQSQFSVGRGSKINVRAGLNNKRSGQITVRTSSSEQLQIALAAVVPIAMAIYKSLRPGTTDRRKYSMY